MNKFSILISVFLNSMLANSLAYGADGAAETGSSALSSMLPLMMIMVVFYFVLIRPQNKKAKEHKTMVEALDRGAKVVINSGIIGTIFKVEKEKGHFIVEIAPNVHVTVLKESIAQLLDTAKNNNKDIKQKDEKNDKTSSKEVAVEKNQDANQTIEKKVTPPKKVISNKGKK